MAVSLAALASSAALAQNSDPESEEIVVSARKRDETALSVPVVLTAVGQKELARTAINNLDGIARIVPQLLIGQADGSVQGGTITLRGFPGGDANPFADQAVSFNIDGAQVARGSVQRMAQMDISQVEVLKGPQALFFGKNSPAGIVVVHTADPTPAFETGASVSYEVYADEVRTDGYLSGPITDSLGMRLALYGSKMRGWEDNLGPSTGLGASSRDPLPHDTEYAGRLTLKYDPHGRFNARLKLAYNHLKTAGIGEYSQYFNCPLGAPQLGGPNDCKADDKIVRADSGPNVGVLDGGFRDGAPYLEQEQVLGSLEMNLNLTDTLKVTSVSSLYYVDLKLADNFTLTPTVATALPGYQSFDANEFSQELRLASSFATPVNFMIGGYYQKSRLLNFGDTFLNAATPFRILPTKQSRQIGDAYSLFGQVNWKIIETVELSGGGRYSHERKEFDADIDDVPLLPQRPERSWRNFSPEVTLAWRPSSDFTLFGAYKRGFLSGGYNAGSTVPSPTTDLSFDQETVKGFEVGAKARLFDGAVRTNLAYYDYKIDGLQVTTLEGITQTVHNAGKSSIRGVEFDADWRTPVEGLSLRGAASYNRARYDVFTVSCYTGQTIALGCTRDPIAGVFTAQSLAGAQIVRAPDWTGSGGFNFERPISTGLLIGLSANASYTSGFFTDTTNKPASRQDGYVLVDSSLRLFTDTNGWEAALIGRNLTNKYYVLRSVDMPLTGFGTGTASPALGADTSGAVSRGREVMFRVTFRFNAAGG